VNGHRLGSWSTPSGNRCEVHLTGCGSERTVEIAWDTFPLSLADAAHFRCEILPDVARRAQEFLELPGPALVVTP
jgi:hypothetical protein